MPVTITLTDQQAADIVSACTQIITLIQGGNSVPGPTPTTPTPTTPTPTTPDPSIPNVIMMDLRPNAGRQETPDFGSNILSMKFTTSANKGSVRVSFAEYGSGTAFRVASLATKPGINAVDNPNDPAILARSSGTGFTFYGSLLGYNTRYTQLQPNTTYYVNVKNWDMAGNQPSDGGKMGGDLVMP